MQNFSAAEMMQSASTAFTGSLGNKLFDQFTLLWWADYLVFCAEYYWPKAKSDPALNMQSEPKRQHAQRQSLHKQALDTFQLKQR